MNDQRLHKTNIRGLNSAGRKAIRVSQEALARIGPLSHETRLPHVIEPSVNGVNLLAWADNNRSLIEAYLLQYGGILFRNFNLKSPDEFEQFISITSSGALEYKERSSPRTQVSGNIYTSTEHPADQNIFLHNENSYQHAFPLKIFFRCVTAAEQVGETPIADCRKIFNRISPKIRERFIEKGWMYVRNFGQGFGLPWQTVFQTSDKAGVEAYCHSKGIEAEWKDGDRLRARHTPGCHDAPSHKRAFLVQPRHLLSCINFGIAPARSDSFPVQRRRPSHQHLLRRWLSHRACRLR